MNIATPISDAISGVDFGFLSSSEIRALSVKRIDNPTTFDTLLNPTPGGLYDAALGGFLENKCSTCRLTDFMGCPGHCGHIELPTRVYHPTFMDQALKLLRAKCVFCHRLRMSRAEVNRFVCKLRLIQHGLIDKAHHIDEMIAAGKGNAGSASDSEEKDDVAGDSAPLIMKRTQFTERSIRRARREGVIEFNEAASEVRKAVIRDMFSEMNILKCKNGDCNGHNPGFRKDKYVKIFRKPCSPKHDNANIQSGLKAQNPLIILQRRAKAAAQSRRKHQENGIIDEGVADMGGSSQDEEDEDIEMADPESENESGTLIAEIATTGRGAKSQTVARPHEYVSANEVRAALVLLFEREHELMHWVYTPRSHSKKSLFSADAFFCDTLLIPPTRYRPEAKTGDGAITEASQNNLYRNILNICETIGQINHEIRGIRSESTYRMRNVDDLQNAFVNLQDAVNSLFDRDRNPIQGAAGKRNEEGIKQILEKKEGLFRKNMMGKRVNFAARSVISPDPNIETNEIGVPPVFAMKLTYPEPVTSHNYYELKEAVLNGPEKWPGAVAIENENGQVIALGKKNIEERMALSNELLAPANDKVNGSRNKKVHRHLNNGDIVIMNRQPTLHKPSMMCHRARVLPGERTIRMHYANCNTYNADFDGDEMNMHFPQNEVARAEAMTIANTDNQYLSATAGEPLRGLIQDHISMAVQLTNKDVFFNREDYQQLLYSAIRPESNHGISGRLLTVAPAIWKPVPLWTGKQVITTVIKNLTPAGSEGLNLTSRSKTPGNFWGKASEEQEVIIANGELLVGIIDKGQIGPTNGGLINGIYEAYGAIAAGKLLSILGRLLTKLLHMRAFSCGVEDLILNAQGDAARVELLQGADKIGLEVASNYVTLEKQTPTADNKELHTRLERVLRDDSKQAMLDEVMKSRNAELSSLITKACLPDTLIKPFPKNQMQAMTGTGAKGTQVNANQISCNLGQQVLEGRRVPIMVSGKSLPSFRPFDTSIRAGGYVMGRFLTGLKPQEYFFHMMSGREGLIDTAVKTSRSGYLQRCLIKGMEGLNVQHDNSVRDSDGSMIQFLYGEDGLDVCKQQYLTNFRFLAENFYTIFESLNCRDEWPLVHSEDADAHQKKAVKAFRKTKNYGVRDPVTAKFAPNRHAGSTSEKFYEMLKSYCEENPDGAIHSKKEAGGYTTKRNFERLLNMKYLKSLIEPGEAVGVVAGQSIGEPSTQMTLNTFHLAGHSSKNVTLGIPRLREIVMTASANISTPSMTLYPNAEMSLEAAEKFAKGISRLSLAEIVNGVSVSEKMKNGDVKEYRIRLDFFPAEEYCAEYAIQVADVLEAVSKRFLPKLQVLIRKELKKKEDKSFKKSGARPVVGEAAGVIEQENTARPNAEADDEGGSEEDEEAEGDASGAKRKANRTENVTYDAPDEEEEAIARDARSPSPGDESKEEKKARKAEEAKTKKALAAKKAAEKAVDQTGKGKDVASDDEDTSSDEEDEDNEEKEDEKDVEESDIEEDEPEADTRPTAGSSARSIAITEDAKDLLSRLQSIKGNADLSAFTFSPHGDYVDFTLEYSQTKLLMLSIVEKCCHDSVIQAIPGLKSCSLDANNKYTDPFTNEEEKRPAIVTDGINLTAMREYQDYINPHLIFTNDIAAMLSNYGVESARATIVREMDSIFKGHGISVDNRHLNLIADVMTRNGGFKPFNRMGLRTNVSPFMKMSFETTVGFLRDAVLEGEREELRGPSGRIVVGGLSKVGTGGFDVLVPISEAVSGGVGEGFEVEGLEM
ncbi:DNA-directed RNA polymerase I subunit RPA1 [Tothia fuscella]|uniref:DNA-directed RNA polymerase subunit n=1 Tax=Tothia fuscella TaxID=1048955 RepID=A0A9P4TSP7_9PEZI|nr:DNA-directed RNA polymerase I subunit RPA1 [Tothia fuscella]